MFGHNDAVGDIEAQPAALAHVLGGEERLEDARLYLGRDAGSVVADLDHDVGAVASRLNSQLAFAVHGIDGVVYQVGPDLVEVAAGGADRKSTRLNSSHL